MTATFGLNMRLFRRASLTPLRLAIFALALFPATLPAGPFEPSRVSADSHWVIHVDLESLWPTSIGRSLVEVLELPSTPSKDRTIPVSLQRLLGTVRSVTAYGASIPSGPSTFDGAILVEGTTEMRKIAESMLLLRSLDQTDTCALVPAFPFPVYLIAESKAQAEQGLGLFIAFPPEPFLIVSRSRPAVLKAQALFGDATLSLAGAKAAPLNQVALKPHAGALVCAGVAPPASFHRPDDPSSRILHLVETASLELREKDGKVIGHSDVSAHSDSDAQKLHRILDGILALPVLAGTMAPQPFDLLRSITVTRAGKDVSLGISRNTDELAALIRRRSPSAR
jgi:hypothetical protein